MTNLIPQISQVIVSVIEDAVRSTGLILESGSTLYPSTQIVTTLMSTDQYFDYNQVLINNTGLFYQHGAVGFDALFVPYTTYYEYSGILPKFTKPNNSSDITVEHLNPFNPLKIYGDQPRNTGIIETGSLNSGVYTYSSDQGTGVFNVSKFAQEGHNISIAATASIYSSQETIESKVHSVSNYYDADFEARKRVELLDIKSIAHRGPLILSGPGYDIEGQPVPGDGSGNFHKEAFWNTSLWPTGPVDNRWDAGRGVWVGGSNTKIYLSKITNTYNPSSYSYEVERSTSRSQYTRNGPSSQRSVSTTGNIYDPEYVAYTGNIKNSGTFEILNYNGIEFPYYEAFIIRETINDVGQEYYNIWSDDCQDCGHISNLCKEPYGRHDGSSKNKKILIENPLKQSLDAGDLAFTVYTGRKKKVNTGNFVGGSGINAECYISTNASGIASIVVSNSGSGYSYGGFGIISSGQICASTSLSFTDGKLSGGTVNPPSGFSKNKTYPVKVYPNNSIIETESLPIHWIMQAEFKTQQVISHVECENGIMQTCSVKLQTQGGKSCEWCGTSDTLLGSF